MTSGDGSVTFLLAADRSAIDPVLADLRRPVRVPVEYYPSSSPGSLGPGTYNASAGPQRSATASPPPIPAAFETGNPYQVSGQSFNGGRFVSNPSNLVLPPQPSPQSQSNIPPSVRQVMEAMMTGPGGESSAPTASRHGLDNMWSVLRRGAGDWDEARRQSEGVSQSPIGGQAFADDATGARLSEAADKLIVAADRLTAAGPGAPGPRGTGYSRSRGPLSSTSGYRSAQQAREDELSGQPSPEESDERPIGDGTDAASGSGRNDRFFGLRTGSQLARYATIGYGALEASRLAREYQRQTLANREDTENPFQATDREMIGANLAEQAPFVGPVVGAVAGPLQNVAKYLAMGADILHGDRDPNSIRAVGRNYSTPDEEADARHAAEESIESVQSQERRIQNSEGVARETARLNREAASEPLTSRSHFAQERFSANETYNSRADAAAVQRQNLQYDITNSAGEAHDRAVANLAAFDKGQPGLAAAAFLAEQRRLASIGYEQGSAGIDIQGREQVSRDRATGELGLATVQELINQQNSERNNADPLLLDNITKRQVQDAKAFATAQREDVTHTLAGVSQTESLIDRDPFGAQLGNSQEQFRQKSREATSADQFNAEKRDSIADIQLATQRRNDDISQRRLELRASDSTLDILNANVPGRNESVTRELARTNDIYQQSRLRQRALHNAGDDTLIPDVITNTQKQLDLEAKSFLQSAKPEVIGRFLDANNASNFSSASDVLSDIAKKRKNVGSTDYSDFGPGGDAGDAASTAASAAAIQKIQNSVANVPTIATLMQTLVSAINKITSN